MNDNNFRDKYYHNLINTNIARYRKILNLTQEQLNDILGYSDNYISKVESVNLNGNLSIPELVRISNLFNIPFSYLFSEVPLVPNKIRKITDTILEEFKNASFNYNEYYSLIRDNISIYRKINNINKKDLSIKIGRSRDYIFKIESNKINQKFSISTLGRIADTLNIPIIKLVEKIDEE